MSAFDAALAIDAGQTGIKVRAVGGDFAASFPGVQTSRPVLPQLAEAVLASARTLGARVTAVAVGATGLSEAEDDPGRLRELCAAAGVSRVLLAHDSVTSYLGALGPAEGVVVAAGTGVVTLGVGADRLARVDGWGNIMGDAGSGYWLGRGALDAVMRAYDGRGPATALTAVVLERFPDLELAYMELQADPDRVRLTASFAKTVSELAGSDAVAAGLCVAAGEELALSAATAAARCDLGPNPAVCLIGSLARSDAVRASFAAALAARVPGYRPTEPAGDGLDGAAALLDLAGRNPLTSLVSVAC